MRKAVLLPTTASCRRMMLALLAALLVGVVALLGFGNTQATAQLQEGQASYTIKNLGTLGGTDGGGVRELNDAGQVAGNWQTTDGTMHAFLYENDEMKDLGTLGGNTSYMNDLNKLGQVVGSSVPDDTYGNSRAFLYENDEMKDLGTLDGYPGSEAERINDDGQVVGYLRGYSDDTDELTDGLFFYENGTMKDIGSLGNTYRNPRIYDLSNAGHVVGVANTANYDEGRAFLYDHSQMSQMKDLGTLPGGGRSAAYGVNDAGQVVGEAVNADGETRAFLYENDEMKDLGELGGGESRAIAINDSGQVVGNSKTADGKFHAFLYENGEMKDLGTLGGDYSSVEGINDSGQVFGDSDTADSKSRAFLYENDEMKDLGSIGGGYGSVRGFNNAGQAVGYSQNATNENLPALYSGGDATDLNDLFPADSGLNLIDVPANINNSGQMAGRAYINGQPTVYLLTHAPPPDSTPPTVSSVSPKNEARGVSKMTNVTATFSEKMDQQTITKETFTLESVKRGQGTLISASVTYDPDTMTATLDPTDTLRSGVYRATIKTQVEDEAGNPLASEYVWLFSV